MAVDQIVPILIAKRELVDGRVRNHRVHSKVRQLQMVFCKVAVGQISSSVRLIIQTVIGLRVVGNVGAVLRVDEPVRASVVAILEEWTRDSSHRLSRKSGPSGKRQFGERRPRLL